ncbi:MAG: hypothetical protein ABEN55_22415 [Bradymonadaceae bacterium]
MAQLSVLVVLCHHPGGERGERDCVAACRGKNTTSIASAKADRIFDALADCGLRRAFDISDKKHVRDDGQYEYRVRWEDRTETVSFTASADHPVFRCLRDAASQFRHVGEVAEWIGDADETFKETMGEVLGSVEASNEQSGAPNDRPDTGRADEDDTRPD